RHVERGRAVVVFRRRAVGLVDFAVAVVVDDVVADLRRSRGDVRVRVVAVAATGAIAVRILVAVGIAGLVQAHPGGLVTAVDRAGGAVGARDRRAGPAPSPRDAPLGAVAVLRVV